MTNNDVKKFLKTLGPLIEAYNNLNTAIDEQPELEGCEIQIQAIIQAKYWISQACNNWLLISKNIVDYNQREWIGAFLEEKEAKNGNSFFI